MRRREFITLLGGAALWPLAALAQQTERMRRIGLLMNEAATEANLQSYVAAFAQGLRQPGWIEGREYSHPRALERRRRRTCKDLRGTAHRARAPSAPLGVFGPTGAVDRRNGAEATYSFLSSLA
jgi:hypothetical protein